MRSKDKRCVRLYVPTILHMEWGKKAMEMQEIPTWKKWVGKAAQLYLNVIKLTHAYVHDGKTRAHFNG